jgi:hypothetical protein
MSIDLPQLAFERILDLLSVKNNYLGYWTIPRDGQKILVRSIEIANDDPISMIIPGVSASIDALSDHDNSRYGGTHRRKQQNFSIIVDHYLAADIDLTDETVQAAFAEYPGVDLPEPIENFGEVIDKLMDSLNDWSELTTVKKPVISQRNVLGNFPPARARIDCVGAVYVPNSAVLP